MTLSTLQFGRFRFRINQHRTRPLVMGIVNVTPDSFSDGGHFFSLDAALSHAEQMIADGVDIIDIGGESSRPGAEQLSIDEELRRVMPLLYALRDCGKPISVDTCKPEVMREAIAADADMINDINGFRVPGALSAVKDADCALCIMHMRDNPKTMQSAPHYDDVVGDITAFLQEQAAAMRQAGIAQDRICVDPGFGFGKTLDHNLALLAHLDRIRDATGFPILAGLSRKSMLGAITGKPVERRLAASIAAALAAAERGAAIVRVHDVAETVDALKVWYAAKDQQDA